MKFHANSLKIRQVDGVILPCIWITNQKKVVSMATNAISDLLRLKDRPTRSRRKVVQGVYAVGLCVLRLLLVKVYSTWTWKIGIKSHRRMLHRHMAPNQNSGKKGSIAKIQKSVPLERSFLRAGIKGKISWGDVAPRKMRPQFSVGNGEKNSKAQEFGQNYD